jgi:hypothetical protein
MINEVNILNIYMYVSNIPDIAPLPTLTPPLPSKSFGGYSCKAYAEIHQSNILDTKLVDKRNTYYTAN